MVVVVVVVTTVVCVAGAYDSCPSTSSGRMASSDCNALSSFWVFFPIDMASEASVEVDSGAPVKEGSKAARKPGGGSARVCEF